MATRRGPSLPKVPLTAETHARVILAASELGQTVHDFMERAAKVELEASRQTVRVRRYNSAVAEADRNRKSRPMPDDFGLPRDYGIPTHP